MDDEVYLDTDPGKETIKILLSIVSPRISTSPTSVLENYKSLEPQYRNLVRSHLRRKIRLGRKINRTEENIIAGLGKLLE